MKDELQLRTLLKFGAFSVAVLLGILYVLFQARFLIIGPQIVANDPGVVQSERRVVIEGTAYNISRLWLNDRQIYTDEFGRFNEAIVLENGYTVATLRAEDRYGRDTQVVRSFVYLPASYIQ